MLAFLGRILAPAIKLWPGFLGPRSLMVTAVVIIAGSIWGHGFKKGLDKGVAVGANQVIELKEELREANDVKEREIENALEAGRNAADLPGDLSKRLQLCRKDKNCRAPDRRLLPNS